MSARNSLAAKRARRLEREEIVSSRLRREREIEEHVQSFVAEKISEMKEAARARLEGLTLKEIHSEVDRHRAAGGEPPKGWRKMKRADLLEALVPTDRLTEDELKELAGEVGG